MNEIQTTQADRLKQLHGEIIGAARMLLDKAIEAGGILQDVKAGLQHGEFTAWIETNAGFNIRTAQRYMKIYEHREELKNDSVSLLTDAHRMLTAPKEDHAEQDKLTYLEGVIEAGLPALYSAGLSLDDALRLAEWDAKYNANHKKILALKEEWETLKDTDSLAAVVDFYKRANEACLEANKISLRAEYNLGGCLNELERYHPDMYQLMMGKKADKTKSGYYIPAPGSALMISLPTAKIPLAIVTPHIQEGFYFRTWIEKDDFDDMAVAGDQKGICAAMCDFSDLFPQGAGKMTVIPKDHEWTGPWGYNHLLYASHDEYMAKVLS